MTTPAAKRTRLELPVLRNVSVADMSILRNQMKNNVADFEHSQTNEALKHLEKQKLKKLKQEWCVFKIQLKQISGDEMAWVVPNLGRFVQWHIQENLLFKQALVQVAEQIPIGQHLKFIFYCDEIVPGNPLVPETKRKIYNIFGSVMDFKQKLQQENLWLPVACFLSKKLNRITGGFSQVFRRYLEAAVEDIHGLFKAGVLLDLPGGPRLLKFDLEAPIADESGLKYLLDVKGASGTKPCFKCANIFSKGHMGSQMEGCSDISESNASAFILNTSSDLWQMQDTLAQDALVMCKTRLDQKERSCGLNLSREGLLASSILREHLEPVRCRFDRMHCYESNGISMLELELISAAISSKTPYCNNDLNNFFAAGFSSRQGKINVTFKNNEFKGMASACLIATHLMYHFLQVMRHVLEAAIADEMASFVALHKVIKQLEHIKKKNDCTASAVMKLRALQRNHMELFLKAYGLTNCRPKHHYSMHLPDQFFGDEQYMDCFATERHQKMVCQIADRYCNHSDPELELQVIARVNRCQVQEVRRLMPDWESTDVIFGERVMISSSMASVYGHCSKNDFVMLADKPVQIQACLRFANRLEVVVELLQKISDVSDCASVWAKTGTIMRHAVSDPCLPIYLTFCLSFFLKLLEPTVFSSISSDARTTSTTPMLGIG